MSSSAKLEEMSREELIELVKNSLKLQKFLRSQIKGLETEKEQLISRYEEERKVERVTEAIAEDESSSRGLRNHTCCECYFALLSRYNELYTFAASQLDDLEQGEDQLYSSVNVLSTMMGSLVHKFSDIMEAESIEMKHQCENCVTNDALEELRRSSGYIKEELQLAKQDIARKDMRLIELDDCRAFIKELEGNVKDLRRQIESQSHSMVSLDEQRQSITVEKDELFRELQESYDENRLLKLNYEKVVTSLEEVRDQVNSYRKQESDYNGLIDRLSKENEELRSVIDCVDSGKATSISELEEQLAGRCRDVERLDELSKSVATRCEQLEARLESEQREHEAYKAKAAQALKRQQTALRRKTSSPRSSEESGQMTDHLLEARISDLSSQNGQLKLEVDRLKMTVTEQKSEITRLKDLLFSNQNLFQDKLEDFKRTHDEVEFNLKEENAGLICQLKKVTESSKKLADASKRSVNDLISKEQQINSLQNDLRLNRLKVEELALKSDHLENVISALQQRSIQSSTHTTTQLHERNNDNSAAPDLQAILNSNYSRDKPPRSRVLFEDTDAKDEEYYKDMRSENLRLRELAAALKLEIRRLEGRSIRQQQLTNSEYLKNILFRFLMSTDRDEKEILTKIISEILVLSDDEIESLRNRATGGSGYFW